MWHDQGNESLVENFNSYFLAPLSHNFNMLHFDPIPITIGYIWLQSYEELANAKNNIKQRNLNNIFANISKTTSPTSDSFHLIMSHMMVHFCSRSKLQINFKPCPSFWLSLVPSSELNHVSAQTENQVQNQMQNFRLYYLIDSWNR